MYVIAFQIRAPRVIGHSDLSPTMRQDPGILFPWKKLFDNGVGAWPSSGDVESFLSIEIPNLSNFWGYLDWLLPQLFSSSDIISLFIFMANCDLDSDLSNNIWAYDQVSATVKPVEHTTYCLEVDEVRKFSALSINRCDSFNNNQKFYYERREVDLGHVRIALLDERFIIEPGRNRSLSINTQYSGSYSNQLWDELDASIEYHYVCSSGTAASGTTSVADIENCRTCFEGATLEGNSCIIVIPTYSYTCLFGTPRSGTTYLAEETENCGTCFEGYVPEGNACFAQEYPYICSSGTPVAGTILVADIENCRTCFEGYVPEGNLCVQQQVDCSFDDVRTILLESVANINACTESSIEENWGLSNFHSLLLDGVTINNILESALWTDSRRSLIMGLATFSSGTLDYIEYISAGYRPFITEWQVTAGQTVIIPVGVDGEGSYFYGFDCDLYGTSNADSRYVSVHMSSGVSYIECSYENAGTYRIAITGSHFHMNFGDLSLTDMNKASLRSIVQWGDTAWVSMDSAFKGASVVESIAEDFPVLFDSRGEGISLSATFSGTFSGAQAFSQSLDNWDVSVATDMSSMFYLVKAFDHPLNNWNVSSVTNMSSMFRGAENFNQDLTTWNVTNVRFCFSFKTSSGLSTDTLPDFTCLTE